MDQPPNYASISIPTITNTIPNTNVNVNMIASISATLSNNEQVVLPQPSAPELEDGKNTDAEPTVPYPQNG